ncbi:hypothetical protein AO368_0955 [Moraxella catarrhalis]|nr:hypothetical protein AO368_0955 [Moraxella catarrhalis]
MANTIYPITLLSHDAFITNQTHQPNFVNFLAPLNHDKIK